MDRQAHVYIYGIIDYFQDSNSSEYGFVNLNNVKSQLEKQSDYDEIIVHIHSEGGVVSEGFAIYNFLKSQGKKVITQIDGVCASIATVVLLAGEERIGNENSTPLIHNPWGMAGGESKDMKKYADELEQLEEDIAEFYAKKTKLSKQEALDLMRVETTFTAEEALANGFLTKIESVMRAVALYNPKNKKMEKTKKKKSKVDKILDKIMNVLNNPKNAKMVQDANGVEIDFFELEDTDTVAVDDKAKVDGKAASGEYVMPSGETYVFAEGALTEIKESEEEEEGDLQAQVDGLEAELKVSKDKYKALKKKHKALVIADSDKEEKINQVAKDMKALKKNMGSNYSPKGGKKKNFKETGGGKATVFKPLKTA